MIRAYKSDIGEFFHVKYDVSGKRTHGKCRLCPNVTITCAKPANYWHHLHNIHHIKPPKPKPNPSTNTNSSSVHSNNEDNNSASNSNDFQDDNMDASDENNTENDGNNSQDLAFGRKRVRTAEPKQKQLGFSVISASKLQKFQYLFTETLAKMGFAHELVENLEFRQLFTEFAQLQCSDSLKFINITQHKQQIISIAKAKTDEIIEILQSSNGLITLAIDGWTGHAFGAKNTNIMALCNGKSYLLWSDRNADERDSTESYLFPLIHEKIQFMWSKNIAVGAITTDNAANMLNIGKELYKLPIWLPNKSAILHISCSAHTVQLMLQDIVNLEPISAAIRDALVLLDPFTTANGKKLRNDLRKQQIRDGFKPLKLVYFNKTRWLSRFATIARLIRLKNYIKWVILNNNLNKYSYIHQDSFWNKLELVIQPLLFKFMQATNMVQQDCASLLHLDQALTGIRKAINDSKLAEHLLVLNSTETSWKVQACGLLNARICNFVLGNGAHYAFWAVSLITNKPLERWESSFGDSNRDYSYTIEWIANWGADLMLFYRNLNQFKLSGDPDKSTIVARINRQIGEFESESGPFSSKQQYLRDLTQEIPKNSINYDEEQPNQTEINWISYWTRMKKTVPELGTIAVCLLSLGISEASCERSFSIQKLTHNALRSRLNEDIVEAEMIIRFNKHVLINREALSECSDSDS
jgi:hypothetical protein